MIRRLVIFGASGDLTGRYLMPAIASLHQCGRLPADFRVLGVAREDWDTEGFRRHIGERLDRHAACLDPGLHEAVLKMLEYRRADAADAKHRFQEINEAYRDLHQMIDQGFVFDAVLVNESPFN